MLNFQFTNLINFHGFQTNSIEEAGLPGFFIWGFKHPVSGDFIPYYVGYSRTNTYNEIKKQVTQINSINSTWMSLSEDYLFGVRPFFSDLAFPILTKKNITFQKQPNPIRLPDWYEKDYWYFFKNKTFDYFHNRAFVANELFRLETDTDSLIIEVNPNNEPEVHGQIDIPEKFDKQRRYPYRIIQEAYLEKGITWNYTLKVLVNKNLWVTYSVIDDSVFESEDYKNYGQYLSNAPMKIKPNQYKEKFFEVLTSYLKYRLKGKTIGIGLPFHELFRHQKRLKLRFEFENSELQNHLFKNEISIEYRGYIE